QKMPKTRRNTFYQQLRTIARAGKSLPGLSRRAVKVSRNRRIIRRSLIACNFLVFLVGVSLCAQETPAGKGKGLDPSRDAAAAQSIELILVQKELPPAQPAPLQPAPAQPAPAPTPPQAPGAGEVGGYGSLGDLFG